MEKRKRKKRTDAKAENAKIGWTKTTLPILEGCQSVLDEMKPYLPLTLRQVYYQLVAKLIIKNTKYSYQRLSDVVSQARYDGIIPWEAIEDRSRTIPYRKGFDNKEQFIDCNTRNLLKGYERYLMQSQPVYVEVWVEKDALVPIFKQAADPYCVKALACRGFGSDTNIKKYHNRIACEQMKGKRPVLLYFGDLDPSGMEMLDDVERRLTNKLEVTGVTFKRIGLNPVQVRDLNLPTSLDAVKDSDPRAPKYIKTYGRLAVELDAVPPATLQRMCREAIEAEIDLDLFEHERMLEQNDLSALSIMRESALAQLNLQ